MGIAVWGVIAKTPGLFERQISNEKSSRCFRTKARPCPLPSAVVVAKCGK